MSDLPPRARLPLLALGFVALLTGVFAGLARLGVAVDAKAASLAGFHGPLMVAGFFGVVISLERAVAAARLWAYAAPLACGLAGIAIFVGEPSVAAGLATLAVAGLELFGNGSHSLAGNGSVVAGHIVTTDCAGTGCIGTSGTGAVARHRAIATSGALVGSGRRHARHRSAAESHCRASG